MAQAKRLRSPNRTVVNLALQGGGAQGAFTWGVLERLLENESIHIGRISGSSAGALNGAALATGMARGGRAGATEHLAMLWERIAHAGSLLTFFLTPLRKPGMGLWDDAMPILSPAQTNPLGMAPLRNIVDAVMDADVLRGPNSPELYVNAVHVQSGSARVFGPEDMSVDAVLASACAPFSYQPVELDGQPYWDGSYSANPSLWPLYRGTPQADILLVELTPRQRVETPLSAKNILNRINEVASINGLVSELRALDAFNRTVPGADIRMHLLSLSDQPAGLLATEPSIKRTVDRALFEMLRQNGREACSEWLAVNEPQIGRQATVDIDQRYLAPYSQPHESASKPSAGL